MKDRIKKIIEFENISYSKFADDVGIQRSGVSHLISGRNNPSLEVIQKIIEAYNYINIEWLLLGKGKMLKEDKIAEFGSLFSDNTKNEELNIDDNITKENNSKSDKNLNDHTVSKILSHSQEDKFSDKQIIKIVIFYSDKTFSEYLPEA